LRCVLDVNIMIPIMTRAIGEVVPPDSYRAATYRHSGRDPGVNSAG
jgi:hypothetical protein